MEVQYIPIRDGARIRRQEGLTPVLPPPAPPLLLPPAQISRRGLRRLSGVHGSRGARDPPAPPAASVLANTALKFSKPESIADR